MTRFSKTYCSECGGEFGPGEQGYSHCEDHAEDEGLDSYGNPLDGSEIINCCFPDCGCDGARLCQAKNGASGCAVSLNIERGSIK